MTVFQRDPGDDELDGFEMFSHFFGAHPSVVFHGGIIMTDTVDSYDPHGMETEVEEEPADQLLIDLKASVEVITTQLKAQKFNLEEMFIKWWVNVRGGHGYAYLILKDQRMVITVHHVPTAKGKGITLYAGEMIEQVEAFMSWVNTAFPKQPKTKQDVIRIITQHNNDFSMTSVNLEGQQHEFDIANYNDDFIPVSERIVSDLNVKNASGLVLLHGEMGTGKTSFLKWLLRAVHDKQIIYVPPDMTSSLSSPAFMAFLIAQARNSILLIEDAENILLERKEGGSQAVSNILNISDGILGDVLKIQIVCTFNRDLKDLDKALRRPGRLIAEYEFRKLSVEKTEYLMMKIYGNDVKYPKKTMSLAEVYNFENAPEQSNPPARTKTIGFITADAE